MLLNEWNWDEARDAWHEAGLEEGWTKGMASGLAQGLASGMERGREEGLEEGMERGMAKRDVELLAMIDAGCGLEELRERLAAGKGRL